MRGLALDRRQFVEHSEIPKEPHGAPGDATVMASVVKSYPAHSPLPIIFASFSLGLHP